MFGQRVYVNDVKTVVSKRHQSTQSSECADDKCHKWTEIVILCYYHTKSNILLMSKWRIQDLHKGGWQFRSTIIKLFLDFIDYI